MEHFKEGSQAYQITGMSALFAPIPPFLPLSFRPFPNLSCFCLPFFLLFYRLALILHWDILTSYCTPSTIQRQDGIPAQQLESY